MVKLSFISIYKFDDKKCKVKDRTGSEISSTNRTIQKHVVQNKWDIILTLTLTVHLLTMWS